MTEPEINAEEMRRIAKLARLHLTPEQEAHIALDFKRILAHVNALSQVDTTGVSPMVHAVSAPLRLRDDAVTPSLSVEVALRNAPERLGDGFGVPKIIE